MSAEHSVTVLLQRWNEAESNARDELFGILYGELHQLARSCINRLNPGQTLNPTALINEPYIKLCGDDEISIDNRSHFFGIAARAMRNILVDYTRRKSAAKRGDDKALPIEDLKDLIPDIKENITDLDLALTDLEKFDAEKCKIVEMRYFGGLSIDEIAELKGCSPTTIKREWTVAKAWLHKYLMDKKRG